MHKYLFTTLCLLSLFLLTPSPSEATVRVGETSVGISFEADTTGGGIPTTPPKDKPSIPSKGQVNQDKDKGNYLSTGNLPQTGSQDDTKPIILGTTLALALAGIWLYTRVKNKPNQ